MAAGRLSPTWIALSPVLPWLLSSCAAPTSDRVSSVTVTDSAGVRVASITALPSNVVEWRLISAPILSLSGVETGDSAAFARVGATRWLSDGRVIVADLGATRLLLFDSAGAFVRAFGRRGSGPGEFRSITSVSVLPGDVISTFDGGQRRLSAWHPNSGLVRTMTIGGGSLRSWPGDAWFWRDSLVVVQQISITPKDSVPQGGGVRRWPLRGQLSLRRSDGTTVANSSPFQAMYTALLPDGDTWAPFSNKAFTTVTSNRVYFGSGETFALRYVDSTFALSGVIRWPALDETLTGDEVRQVRDEAASVLAARMSTEEASRRLESNFDREILPTHRPSIGRVVADAEGQLWVERYEALRIGSELQKAGERWTILRPDGSPVARLVLPPDSRLEDVRGDRVLLVTRDSFDVQRVEVRQIRKGEG
jgi:hypothetical protein